MRRFQQVAFVLGLVALEACAAGPSPQTRWVNPNVAPELQQHRFNLDSTECVALANQMIAEPPPPPQGQSGTFTMQTPSGPAYGTYQTQPPTQQRWQPSGALAGMQRSQREQHRRDYAVSCMANRGWRPQ